MTARVKPEALPSSDPLAHVDGVTNAIVFQADPIGSITVVGPGAGPQIAGQGVLSDVVAVTRWRAPAS